jgi:dTDP-4-dehydrorhamnose reductase
MQKILILGAKGMLGSELVKLYKEGRNTEKPPKDSHDFESLTSFTQGVNNEKYEIVAWDIDDVDVRDFENLKKKINEVWPDMIYNAVAYNAVDSCEEDDEEYEKAKVLNSDLPGELAKIAKNLDATLVHYSTDYVFDGERPVYKNRKRAPHCCGNGCDGCQYLGKEKTVPHWQYMENDQPNPLSRYGWTKYRGEQIVEKEGEKFYIIRLSKLFGGNGKNALGKKSFFEVMLEKGREKEEVKVVDDELSKFTYAPDLAQESKNIVEENEPFGIYHIVNEGAVTWYEGLNSLYKIAGLKTKVVPVRSEEFSRLAKRPSVSVLQNKKRKPLRNYEEAIKEWLEN